MGMTEVLVYLFSQWFIQFLCLLLVIVVAVAFYPFGGNKS